MNRRGFTLIELLIGITVLAIVGTALTRLTLSQYKFFGQQQTQREARSVSRAAVNLLLSDLRMVETGGGVVAASALDVTIRVPYAFGVICQASAGQTIVSMLSVDSTAWAGAGFSGYAARGPTGAYTYIDGATSAATTSTQCTSQSVNVLSGGRAMVFTPGSAAFQRGDAVLLYQNIRYDFAASDAVPGRLGLFRTIAATSAREELVAPFQTSSGFEFYVAGSNTPQVTPPAALSDLRGLRLVLDGASESVASGMNAPSQFDLSTAVYFQNLTN